jgi:hypothetical protein
MGLFCESSSKLATIIYFEVFGFRLIIKIVDIFIIHLMLIVIVVIVININFIIS